MKKTLLLLLLLPFLGFAQAVPAGSYVISSGSAAPLNSLANAIAYINPRGIGGNVTLLIDNDQTVAAGTQILINEFTGSSTYTLTIKPNDGKNINIIGDVNNALFALNGADNIIIDGNNTLVDNALRIYNNHTTSAENSRLGIRLYNNADNNIFRNLSIQLNIIDKTKDVFAIGVCSGGTTIGDAGNNSNNTISNIKFINVKQPVFIVGSDNNNKNWTITKSTMGSDVEDNQPSLGIYLSNVNGYVISNNTISGITKSSNYNSRTASGITLLETSTGSIYNNIISNITNKQYTNSSSTAGIFINSSSSSSNTIYNNIISNVYTAQNDNNDYNYHYPGHGIYIKTSGTNKLYYNTIVQKPTSTTNGRSSCIFIEDATSVDLKNNILYNTRANGTQYALFSRITPSKLTSNYNAFYGTSANLPNIIRSESTAYSLAGWKTYSAKDDKSTTTAPTFVDFANSNFHLNTTATSNADLLGIQISGITTDIDGDTRVKPYMGADEIFACTPPTITTQPTDLVACEGQNGSFSVVTSTAGATYQWQYSADGSTGWTNTDGTAFVSDHNKATLVLTNIPLSYSNYYVRCIVSTSSTCFTNSGKAKLTVNPALTPSVTVTSSEASTTICDGTLVTFTANPTNPGAAPKYQWYLGGNALTGQTGKTWTTNTLNNGDQISVVLTSNATPCLTTPTATSNVITVTIIKTDRGRTKGGSHICQGTASPTLTVYNFDDPNKDQPYTDTSRIIRWEYSDDNNQTWTPIAGTAGLVNYTPGILAASRNFRAVAKNPSCVQGPASIETRIDVEFAPTIDSQSTATQTQCIGGTFNPLTVTASGFNIMSYQWYSNTTASTTGGTSLLNANGARTNSYTPQSATAGTVYYYCIVTGKCGPVTSAVSGAIITKGASTPPTVGTIKQPSCTVSTGSVVLGNVPASGKLIESRGTTYNFVASGTTYEVTGLAPGTYKFAIDDNCGVQYSADIVIQSTNVWDGTKWSAGIPTTADNIIEFKGNYSENVDLTGCSCTVSNNAVVVIKTGKTLKITNAVNVVSGTLTFEDKSSLVQINNVANTGNITYKRIAPKIRQADYVYWSTPVNPQKLVGVSPLTMSDKFFYNNAPGWIAINSNSNMEIGRGYIIRGPETYSNTARADYEASFNGVPNNGDISTGSLAVAKYHLIGNPYPSALSVDKLIDGNTVLNGTVYLWTHNTAVNPVGNYNYNVNDYAVYNRSGSVGTVAKTGNASNASEKPTGYIAAGQAFFVSTKLTGPVNFTNLMREGITTNSQFFKSNETSKETAIEKNRVWLNMTSGEGAFKQLLVGYIEGASNGYENKFDGITMDGNSYMDFYSMINANKFTIQGRALPFVDTDIVPLGYRTAVAGSFTISIDEVDGSMTNQAIYIEDKVTGAVHDLRYSDYTFTSEIGAFTDRLVLRYTGKTTLGTGDFENLENGLLVSVKNKVIDILSSKENIKEVTVYDITGKLLYNKKKVGTTELQIQNLPSSNQVLLVKVTLENDFVTTRKVIFN
jgi:hypothetical protein